MNNRRRTLGSILIVVLTIVGLAGLVTINIRYARQNPGGNDFIPRWLGTRLFLIEGQSPYSQQTTLQIQEYIFGRPAQANEDQSLFVYPFYSIFLFAPFSVIKDFALARALWMVFLELSLLIVVIISLNLIQWRLSPLMLGWIFLFSILWYHSVRPIINGNPSVFVALFIVLAFLTIRVEQDALAGFFLAFATLKPQMLVLLIPFVLIWAFSHRRWTLINSTLASLVILVVVGYFLDSKWIMENLQQIFAYPDYTLPGSPGAIFAEWLPGVGNQMGWVLTVFMAGILLWEWRAAWKQDFQWFLWTACLTLTVTNLIGVRTATANYIALLPAVLLVFKVWDERWGVLGRWLVIVSSVLLFGGLWWLFLATIQLSDQPIQNPIMFFPLPFFLLIGLYWVRHWALHSSTPLLNQLRRSQNPN